MAGPMPRPSKAPRRVRPNGFAGSPIAEAVEREGTADASAILARGKAEAEAMDQRSQAFSTYGEAAVLDLLVKVLPEIVKAAAAPLASVDKITMITMIT